MSKKDIIYTDSNYRLLPLRTFVELNGGNNLVTELENIIKRVYGGLRRRVELSALLKQIPYTSRLYNLVEGYKYFAWNHIDTRVVNNPT